MTDLNKFASIEISENFKTEMPVVTPESAYKQFAEEG